MLTCGGQNRRGRPRTHRNCIVSAPRKAHLAVRAPKPCALERQPARIVRFAPPTRQHEAQPKLGQHLHRLLGNRRPEASRARCTADDSDCLWVVIERSSLDLRSVPLAARPSGAPTVNGSTVVGPCADEKAADKAERTSRETLPSPTLLGLRAGSRSDMGGPQSGCLGNCSNAPMRSWEQTNRCLQSCALCREPLTSYRARRNAPRTLEE